MSGAYSWGGPAEAQCGRHNQKCHLPCKLSALHTHSHTHTHVRIRDLHLHTTVADTHADHTPYQHSAIADIHPHTDRLPQAHAAVHTHRCTTKAHTHTHGSDPGSIHDQDQHTPTQTDPNVPTEHFIHTRPWLDCPAKSHNLPFKKRASCLSITSFRNNLFPKMHCIT